MEMVQSKIKFYNFGSEKINLSNILNDGILDYSKSLLTSDNFNVAMKNVIENDLKKLQIKINELIKQIKRNLIKKGIPYELENTNIENIDSIIKSLDDKISFLIIEGNNNKVGLFTLNKKSKKRKNTDITETLEFLTKSQTDIISIKNEYNKLIERKKLVASTKQEYLKEEKQKEDPLERTINFYMNKGNL